MTPSQLGGPIHHRTPKDAHTGNRVLLVGGQPASAQDWDMAAAQVLRKARRLPVEAADKGAYQALSRSIVEGIHIPPLGTQDRLTARGGELPFLPPEGVSTGAESGCNMRPLIANDDPVRRTRLPRSKGTRHLLRRQLNEGTPRIDVLNYLMPHKSCGRPWPLVIRVRETHLSRVAIPSQSRVSPAGLHPMSPTTSNGGLITRDSAIEWRGQRSPFRQNRTG